MAIQDLQIKKRKLVGYCDLGDEGTAYSSKHGPQLANHVLQFVFLGFTGFRFLVAHFPTAQANAAQIYTTFWDVVNKLGEWGFHVHYACFDGASNNRTFMKFHTSTPPTLHLAYNYFSGGFIHFIPDPKHLLNFFRNNILKSGKKTWHTRLLTVKKAVITWIAWVK